MRLRASHQGRGPGGVDAPVQYGPRIAAVIIYLYIGQFLSKERTAQALAELFGVPLSPGTVAGITARAAGKLDGFADRVRENITASAVAGFDETGFRVAGRLHRVHCARTGKYTLLMVHPRRGTQAMEAMGILPSFAGVAVHDAWAPYDTYATAGHQLCCTHALRELQAVADSAPEGGWCWAAQVAEALTTMQALVSEASSQGRDAVDPAALAAQIYRYRSAVLLGTRQTAARSGKLMKKHHALARRLLDRQDDYLRFTRDWRIPADNIYSPLQFDDGSIFTFRQWYSQNGQPLLNLNRYSYSTPDNHTTYGFGEGFEYTPLKTWTSPVTHRNYPVLRAPDDPLRDLVLLAGLTRLRDTAPRDPPLGSPGPGPHRITHRTRGRQGLPRAAQPAHRDLPADPLAGLSRTQATSDLFPRVERRHAAESA